ncbi:MAG TPA: hypothetical protein VK420_18740 [Longimicrobium sp.]|nr:hypothetical protein [Longimicrobium sp.]
MNAPTRIQVLLAALVSLVATGCGGGITPVSGYQNDTLYIHAGAIVSVTIHSCNGINDGVTATVNGHAFSERYGGGFTAKGCTSPSFTLRPLPTELVKPEPIDAHIRLADESGTIDVEVEKLLGPYKIASRRAGLVAHVEGSDHTPPVLARGETITFELPAGVAPRDLYHASVSTRSVQNPPVWGLTPQFDGSSFTVSVPADLPAGEYDFGFFYTANPTVLKCTGVRACEAVIQSTTYFRFDVR